MAMIGRALRPGVVRTTPAWQRRGYTQPAVARAAQAGQANAAVLGLAHTFVEGLLEPYWAVNPTSVAAVDLLQDLVPEDAAWDHLAFRTLGVQGMGIGSLAGTFEELGWRAAGDLTFPAKKLRARWYAPPESSLPRVFISELAVEELSGEAQRAIDAALGAAPRATLARFLLPCAANGVTPWAPPTREQYDTVAKESEYGAWVLANGAALNHTTLSVHAMQGIGGLDGLIDRLQRAGFALNAEGGVAKISPDGLLLQASTRADSRLFNFSCGDAAMVPAAYIEFAERLPLPQFAHLPEDQLREEHRRDGFEVGNADKIFESTYTSKA